MHFVGFVWFLQKYLDVQGRNVSRSSSSCTISYLVDRLSSATIAALPVRCHETPFDLNAVGYCKSLCINDTVLLQDLVHPVSASINVLASLPGSECEPLASYRNPTL